MKTFKTKAGTEIPLLDLRGKDYLQVAHRLVWCREEHPDWSIKTERIEATDKFVLYKASILDATGRLIATAHKREDFAHFQDANEKAETSAVGRALALCGYGTQFAPDLDEGDRLADAPIGDNWTAAQKLEYARIRFGENAKLTMQQRVECTKIAQSKSFETAMKELGNKS